jgi:hypothetical protein
MRCAFATKLFKQRIVDLLITRRNIDMVDKSIVSLDYFLSILDKAENGNYVDEKDWDRVHTQRSLKDILKKFDISWSRDDIRVSDDDELADRVFEAGFELALKTGVYNIDTKRQMLWTRDELEGFLSTIPTEAVCGADADAVTITRRDVEEDKYVAVSGGPYGIPVSEDVFYPMAKAYVSERLIDFYEAPSLLSVYGREVRANAPLDPTACWHEAEMIFDALKEVGRPGMGLGTPNSTASAVGVLSSMSHNGVRPTDWNHNSFLSELKISNENLLRMVHFYHTGAYNHSFYNPIFGGYAGGGPGVAVIGVAGLILMKACLLVDTVNLGPSHAHLSCSTYPEIIVAKAIAFQALARNTRLITACFSRPAAGPGTKEILYEVAAMTLACVPSGVGAVKGVQSATGRFEAACTPLEVRFMAQVAHAAEKMSRKEVDPIVRSLIDKFKDTQRDLDAMVGKPFNVLYDLDSLEPNAEWIGMYEEVCAELEQMGVKL